MLNIILSSFLFLFSSYSLAMPYGLCGQPALNTAEPNGILSFTGRAVSKTTEVYDFGDSHRKEIHYYQHNKLVKYESYLNGVKSSDTEFTYKDGLLTHESDTEYNKSGLKVNSSEQSYSYGADGNPYKFEEVHYDFPSGKESSHQIIFIKRSPTVQNIVEDVCLNYQVFSVNGEISSVYKKSGIVGRYQTGPQGILYSQASGDTYSGPSDEESIYSYLSNSNIDIYSGFATVYKTAGNEKTSTTTLRGSLYRKYWFDNHGKVVEQLDMDYEHKESRYAYKISYDEHGNVIKRISYDWKFNGLSAADKYSFVKSAELNNSIEYE